MKKLYLFSLLATAFSINAVAQTFWSDNFEDAGSPSIGIRTTSIAEFRCSSGFFKRTDGSDITWPDAFTGYNGLKYFGAMDIDRGPSCGGNNTISPAQSITWSGINIAGKTGIMFKGLFGANSAATFQGIFFNDAANNYALDYMIIEYRIDGSPTWQQSIAIYPNDATANGGKMARDTNGDMIGDGPALGSALSELSGNITGTGSTLDLRIRIFVNNQTPGAMAFDNFRLMTTATNTAPTASNVANTGTLKEGQTLTGTYTYVDAESNAESGSTFKWYRSDNASGLNKSAIASASSTTYVLTASDVNKYISFEVTPRDGSLNGTAVESPLRGPIAPITLPVGLMAFNVSVRENYILLNWTTASERDNRQFIVYRSGDDGVFSAIGDVKGSGNSSVAKGYTYIDRMPIKGKNYYRLAQVDVDGTEQILETRSVSFDIAKSGVSLYPNPVYNVASASFKPGMYSTAKLVDNNGKIIRVMHITADASFLNIDLSGFARGIYSLVLLGKGDRIAIKVIKK
jgi:hypothetical protein